MIACSEFLRRIDAVAIRRCAISSYSRACVPVGGWSFRENILFAADQSWPVPLSFDGFPPAVVFSSWSGGAKLAVVAQLGSVNRSSLEIREECCVEYEIENDWSVRNRALVQRGGSGTA